MADFNGAAVGTYKDQVYSIGQFDVALLIYARKSVLDANKIRIPTLDKPWTLDEFNKALDTLKASGKFENAIDVGSAGSGEWWPYAYSPLLQSFGGDLIDRKTYLTADKVLNGPEAVKWGQWFQSLFKNGYANPKPVDDQGFYQGRVGPVVHRQLGGRRRDQEGGRRRALPAAAGLRARGRRSAGRPGSGASAAPARTPMAPGSSSRL